MVFKGDTLYVGTREEVRIYMDTDNDLRADTNWTFFDDLPSSQHPYEWTSGLSFGPDGWLYCALTTDSWNAGASNDPRGYRGSIIRISPDGKTSERMATGIRSVHGMAFHPNGHLFFVDNQGGGNPVEELNLLNKGSFYGHNPMKYNEPDSVTGPVVKLNTDIAPSGIVFNTSANDFGGTGGDLFIAFYGPAELWDKGSLCRVHIGNNATSLSYEEVVVADIPKLSALSFGSNGSLYLASHGESDYWYNPVKEKTGGLYRMEYDASVKPPYPERKKEVKKDNLSASAVEKGKALYAERSCFACHSTDGSTEMLGDALNGISKRMTREEIRKSIELPSDIIKPSMAGMRITKKDGQIILGRMIHGDQDQLTLMLVGNKTITIPRTEIEKTETETKSLMYEGLLHNLTEEEIGYLLDYLESI